jgi:hypothetical protein
LAHSNHQPVQPLPRTSQSQSPSLEQQSTQSISEPLVPPRWLIETQADLLLRELKIRQLAGRETHRKRNQAISRLNRRGNPVVHSRLPALKYYSVRSASEKENISANRYANILPYDRNAITIGGRHIGASWVKETEGGAWWIASQVSHEESSDFRTRPKGYWVDLSTLLCARLHSPIPSRTSSPCSLQQRPPISVYAQLCS